MIQGTIGNGLGPIKGIRSQSGPLALLDGFGSGSFNGVPVPPQVPLADRRGGVSALFQHFGQGEPGRIEDRISERIHDSMKFSPVVSPGEKRIPTGRADTRGRMTIGKKHSFLSQFFQVGSGNF